MMKELDLVELFGQRLRNGRKSANMTQQQLHLSTGIATAFISGVESGKNNCSLKVANTFANAVGMTLADMLSP
jgi:transcriptional regulator with XRE-family HTH domain